MRTIIEDIFGISFLDLLIFQCLYVLSPIDLSTLDLKFKHIVEEAASPLYTTVLSTDAFKEPLFRILKRPKTRLGP